MRPLNTRRPGQATIRTARKRRPAPRHDRAIGTRPNIEDSVADAGTLPMTLTIAIGRSGTSGLEQRRPHFT